VVKNLSPKPNRYDIYKISDGKLEYHNSELVDDKVFLLLQETAADCIKSNWVCSAEFLSEYCGGYSIWKKWKNTFNKIIFLLICLCFYSCGGFCRRVATGKKANWRHRGVQQGVPGLRLQGVQGCRGSQCESRKCHKTRRDIENYPKCYAGHKGY